jgi:hypothetical protein
MTASLHIAGTGSSVLDSAFACRQQPHATSNWEQVTSQLRCDVEAMSEAGVKVAEFKLIEPASHAPAHKHLFMGRKNLEVLRLQIHAFAGFARTEVFGQGAWLQIAPLSAPNRGGEDVPRFLEEDSWSARARGGISSRICLQPGKIAVLHTRHRRDTSSNQQSEKSLTTRLPLLPQPDVDVLVLAGSRVILSDDLVLLADLPPAVLVEGLDLLGG